MGVGAVRRSLQRRGVLAAGAGALGAGSGVAAAVLGYYARMVVTPPKQPRESLKILRPGTARPRRLFPGQGPGAKKRRQGTAPPSAVPDRVVLPADADTLAPGHYLLTFGGGTGAAVVGEIIDRSPDGRTVTRSIESIHSGDLSGVRRGRWSGALYCDPEGAGFSSQDVQLRLPVGPAPAWFVPAPSGSVDGTWAVMVHGRGARRQETLRALPATQSLDMPSLHISYRNDHEAPPSEDGRYGLGFTEWEDVESAIDYALEHGARDVVLFGWSMGGAIVLRTVDRTRHPEAVRAVVLDGPVVDWYELMAHQSGLNRLPRGAGRVVARILSGHWASKLVGLGRPIGLDELDWISRSEELTTPTLVLHSRQDTFVPSTTTEHLARINPHVDLVLFPGAPHTKEWNTDPQRWTDAVVSWLGPLLPRDGAPRPARVDGA